MNPHLEESIEHWERLSSGNRLPNEVFGSDDCALCKAYCLNAIQSQLCEGCPVKEKTGLKHCDGTPFDKIRQLDRDWFATHDGDTINELMDTPEFKQAALEELEFLKSLREP